MSNNKILNSILIVFILSYVFTWIIRYLAQKKAILDIPNERSSHSIPTPRGGGIAISLVWFLWLAYQYMIHGIPSSLFFALMSGIAISIIGSIDDIFSLKPSVRLFVQIAASVAAIYFLGGFDHISLGFISFSNSFILNIAAVFFIVWFTNIFNFLDGIDGYISAETLFIGFAIYILFGSLPALILAAITGGFLIWNWQPAKIFMGDSGSTLIGFSMAILALNCEIYNATSLIVFMILTSVFWFDASITLLRRIRNKEKLSQAHKKHAYQRIVQAGFSHQLTVLWAFFINILCFLIAIVAKKYEILSCIFLIINMILLSIFLRYIDKKNPFIIQSN